MLENVTKNRLALAGVGIATIAVWSFTKLDTVEQVSAEIGAIPSLHNETLVVTSITRSDKNFVINLALSGSEPDIHQELKQYYQSSLTEYVCSSGSFDAQFDEGYNISFEITNEQQSKGAFGQMYVAKQNCTANNS